MKDLNTSYVLVQHRAESKKEYTFMLFKYILCFGSTKRGGESMKINPKFKYILCFGSTKRKEVNFKMTIEFKYILCFGSTVYIISKRS